MNQDWLIQNVLKHLDTVPDTPKNDREYLSFDECIRIVDETVDFLGANGDETEYTYINGHKKRLAHSLSMIPIAQGKGESCLDVGSYGYMALWAKKYLGYERVDGIEWHPDVDDQVIHRSLELNDEKTELHSYNFDISQPEWSISDKYDTVLFFEVLEHINHDPMGVMSRIHTHLKAEGTLVMSVPNSISYKAFKEFLVGMPPWTYWFYEPDLSHEPRHCFEYTPIVFKALVQAAGLEENAFRTIYAYTDPEKEEETLEIARSFGIQDDSFGETMIINATKVSDKINIRYPDVLYSPDGYYKNVYPHLHDRFDQAIQHFRDSNNLPVETIEQEQEIDLTAEYQNLSDSENALLRQQLDELLFTCDSQLKKQDEMQAQILALETSNQQANAELQQNKDWAQDLQRQKYDLEVRVNELLFTCDCYLRKEGETDTAVQDAEKAKASAMIEIHDTKVWAESLVNENADLRGQINELLFACDCYLQQINDPQRCVQVIREKRFRSALDTSKSIARKTPVLRTALRPVYRGTKKFIKRRM
jgi:2-polyprenyl-3-methyl-5-hydroxy-6-metoxy-1,4-benzoquinol methylase